MTTCNFRFTKQQNGFYIACIGCIASGKSSFTEILGDVIKKERGECYCLYEPAAKEDGEESVFLPSFYQDQKRWAFTVQVEMLTKRVAQHKMAQSLAFNGISSVSDSLWESDGVFVNLLEKEGKLIKEEADLYYRLFSELSEGLLYPSAVIYLSVKPEKALERLNKRISEKAGRKMESDIPLFYLQGLISEYNELISYIKNFCHVITLDWNKDRTKDEIKMEASKIWEFIKTLKQNCPIGSQLGI